MQRKEAHNKKKIKKNSLQRPWRLFIGTIDITKTLSQIKFIEHEKY